MDGEAPSRKPKGEDVTARAKQSAERVRDMYENIQRVIERNKVTLEDTQTQVQLIEEMIKQMHTMQDDIDQQMIAMKRAAAAKNVNIDKLLEETNQFSSKGREVVRKMEDDLKKKVANITPREACLTPNAKTKEVLTKERKGKTRGARNNWLPMH